MLVLFGVGGGVEGKSESASMLVLRDFDVRAVGVVRPPQVATGLGRDMTFEVLGCDLPR